MILFEGTPEDLARNKKSFTATFLKKELEEDKKGKA
jgi:excinuclease UvrABC ATPase subunit